VIVTVSSTFPTALHAEIESLVRAGFEGVEATDVEVHVKARAQVRRVYEVRFRQGRRTVLRRYARKRDAVAVARRHQGRVESKAYRHPRAGGWSARTYDGVPGIARVATGIRYLVTMNIPADPRRLTAYPVTHAYPGLKTAPVIRFDTWQEELFGMAAHEARHVDQFRYGWKRSEIDAEQWALLRLEERRAMAARSVGDDDAVVDELTLFELEEAEGVVRLGPPVGG